MENKNSSPSAAKIPSIKEGLRKLILSALDTQYMAESCQDRIQTTNSYQSIQLGDKTTSGFRTGRAEYMDRISFNGRKVLDLGSNLGELSRMARARGASLVDGFEYDPYFLEIARAVNAYNEVSRVSFYKRDISDPSIYSERYDIVMAWSVFIYLSGVVEQLAKITNQILIIETHRLDNNLESTYLGPIGKYFPYHKLMGQTEWGTAVDAAVRRAVIVFAKDQQCLEALVDAAKLNGNPRIQSDVAGESEVAVDVFRTVVWLNSFFDKVKFDTPEELLKSVSKSDLNLECVHTYLTTSSAMSGWLYWLLYIRGFVEFRQTGQIGANNTYYRYLSHYIRDQDVDPGLASMVGNADLTRDRVRRRFEDFQRFLDAVASGESEVSKCDWLQILPGSNDNPKKVFVLDSHVPIEGAVDGYHRLFLARLFGFRTLRAKIQKGRSHERDQAGTRMLNARERRTSGKRSDLEAEASAPRKPLIGTLEAVTQAEVIGWAWSPSSPDASVDVEILDGDTVVLTATAGAYREDLKHSGYGNGKHSFRVPLPAQFKDGSLHLLTVRVAASRATLANSPMPYTFRLPEAEVGRLEFASNHEVTGWAWNQTLPDAPVDVEILMENTVIATVKADQFREDLKKAGIGNGKHGFRLRVTPKKNFSTLGPLKARIARTKAPLVSSIQDGRSGQEDHNSLKSRESRFGRATEPPMR